MRFTMRRLSAKSTLISPTIPVCYLAELWTLLKIGPVLYQIVNHLKWLIPKSTIDVLGDEDVHNGSLLFSSNGTNLYDLIMLQHQEYVSQQEYDNLKRFVSNGGVLMLLTGNVFYGEVEYDEKTNTIKTGKRS